MNDDKLIVFGKWLWDRYQQQQQELFQLSINGQAPESAIRVKAGHVECTMFVLDAYKDLYNKDLNFFRKEYLGEKTEEDEENKETKQ